MSKANACLQINMAPTDMRYVKQTLPHQLRVLAGQVDEIQFTLDTRPRPRDGTRYTTENYEEKLAEMRRYLEDICDQYPHAGVVHVDYSASTINTVARTFTGTDFVPRLAYNGGPFYAYLFGILCARNDYVLHMDSDMLFGGGYQNWVVDAIKVLQRNSNVLACYPLGGPPRADGKVIRQVGTLADKWLAASSALSSNLEHLAFSYPDVSTRVFFVDRRIFLDGKFKIPLVRPRLRTMAKTLLFKSSRQRLFQDVLFLLTVVLDRRRVRSAQSTEENSPMLRRAFNSFLTRRSPYLNLEDCLSILAASTGSRYIGFLGSDPGLWSLHLSYRSERFYRELSRIIERVESDDVPDAQRGDFDLNNSMLDWSDVRPSTRWERLRERR